MVLADTATPVGLPMPESREVLAAVEASMVRVVDMPAILGVTVQRCHQLANRADFPRPMQTVPGRRLGRRSDVELWREEIWARPWVPR